MKKYFFTFCMLLFFGLSLAGCERIKSGLQPSDVSGDNEVASPAKDMKVIHSARLEHQPAEGLPVGWSDGFGAAIAVGEGVLAIGAPSASDGTEFNDGSVFIYHKQGDQWIEEEQLSPREHKKSVNQSFGTSLAFAGDVLYVGAPGAEDPQESRISGMVYVFQEHPEGWQEIAQLVPDILVPHENIGSQLSAQGDTLAVTGGYQDYQPKRVVIFRRNGNRWTQEASLEFPSIQGVSSQINSLALYGDSLVVYLMSVDTREENPQSSNHLLIFERSGNEWRGPTELDTGEFSPNGVIALDGDGKHATRLAASVGQDWSRLLRAVTIYERSEAGWELSDSLASPDGGYMDHIAHIASFGASIALDGDTMLVGAPTSNEDSLLDGVAYLFKREQDRWVPQLRLASPVDGTAEEYFGSPMDLSGSILLISGFDETGYYPYVFEIGEKDQ
jgi:hypothetical protein